MPLLPSFLPHFLLSGCHPFHRNALPSVGHPSHVMHCSSSSVGTQSNPFYSSCTGLLYILSSWPLIFSLICPMRTTMLLSRHLPCMQSPLPKPWPFLTGTSALAYISFTVSSFALYVTSVIYNPTVLLLGPLLQCLIRT